jgi:hypothetical protein
MTGRNSTTRIDQGDLDQTGTIPLHVPVMTGVGLMMTMTGVGMMMTMTGEFKISVYG